MDYIKGPSRWGDLDIFARSSPLCDARSRPATRRASYVNRLPSYSHESNIGVLLMLCVYLQHRHESETGRLRAVDMELFMHDNPNHIQVQICSNYGRISFAISISFRPETI